MYEMGVSIALGASGPDLFGLVLKLSLRLVLTGLAIGLMLTIAVTWALRSFLYGVGSRDPIIFVAVSVLLIAVAIVAGLVPARRAAQVDPMTAPRAEQSLDVVIRPATADQFLDPQPARNAGTSSPACHSIGGLCCLSAANKAFTSSTSAFNHPTDDTSISPFGSM